MVTFTHIVRDDSMSWHIILKELECPRATQDLKLNTKNRDAAVKNPNIRYGHLILKMKNIGKSMLKDGKLLPK